MADALAPELQYEMNDMLRLAENDSRRMHEIAKVYLDENLSEMDRSIKIMRILKYAYESNMSEKRLARDNHIPAQFLTKDGEVKDAEWTRYQESWVPHNTVPTIH